MGRHVLPGHRRPTGTSTCRREALRFFPLYPSSAGPAADAVRPGTRPSRSSSSPTRARSAPRSSSDGWCCSRRRTAALAERAVWLVALFPSAFVLVWAYAEALFLVSRSATFLSLRRDRYELAAVTGCLLAALARPIGRAAGGPAGDRGVAHVARRAGVRRAPAARWRSLAPVAGLALYLGWVGWRFGDPKLPFTVQNKLRGEAQSVTRLVHGRRRPVRRPSASATGCTSRSPSCSSSSSSWCCGDGRSSYGVFAGLVLLVAALSADNLNSLERYALNAFPIVLTLGSLTDSDGSSGWCWSCAAGVWRR